MGKGNQPAHDEALLPEARVAKEEEATYVGGGGKRTRSRRGSVPLEVFGPFGRLGPLRPRTCILQ